MGKVRIRRVEGDASDSLALSITSLLQNAKISKIGDDYHIFFGSTEMEISADLMKDLIENAFMMLDYEDQKELMQIFEGYMM